MNKKDKLLDDVAILWPHIGFFARFEWAKRIAKVFEISWPEAVNLVTARLDKQDGTV